MVTKKGQVVDRHQRAEWATGGAGGATSGETGIPGLVPGTRFTLDELQQMQIRARREQAKAVRAALLGAGAWLVGGLRRVAADIRRRRAVRKAVRELNALDDRLLRDIGISRSDIPAVAAGTADPRLGAPWVRQARAASSDVPAHAEETRREAA